MDIFSEFITGSQRALAKLITLIENFDRRGFEILTALENHYKNSPRLKGAGAVKQSVIGITGPPGSGKSSIVDHLVRKIIGAGEGKTVGVAAFDPSSPFTGGAILGDRVRMSNFTSPDLFFRSMGTRGSLGGMSKAISYVLRIYELYGFDYIIVETVGVGQLEIDVVKMTDTTIIAEVPGLGDEIQAIKAGLFEIGDIFVINKNDRPGVDKIFCEINYMLGLRRQKQAAAGESESEDKDRWHVPIIKTNCINGEGIDELLDKINAHRDMLYKENKILQNRNMRLREQYMSFARDFIEDNLMRELSRDGEFKELVKTGRLNIFESAAGPGFKKIMLKMAALLSDKIESL
jgi:LAO/AO transport system kinase